MISGTNTRTSLRTVGQPHSMKGGQFRANLLCLPQGLHGPSITRGMDLDQTDRIGHRDRMSCTACSNSLERVTLIVPKAAGASSIAEKPLGVLNIMSSQISRHGE